MSKSPPRGDLVARTLRSLVNRVGKLEVRPAKLPLLAADPTYPEDGEVWYRAGTAYLWDGTAAVEISGSGGGAGSGLIGPYLRKHKTGTTSLTSGTAANVPISATDENVVNDLGEFDLPTTSTFSPPLDGFYQVEIQVEFAAHAAATRRIVQLYNETDGQQVAQITTPSINSGSQSTIVGLSETIELLASKDYAVRARQDSGGALNVDTDTHFSVTFMGIDPGGGTVGEASMSAHEADSNPHPGYTTDAEATTLAQAEVTSHEGESDPHTGYQKESEKEAANGYPGLDASGFLKPFDPFDGTPGQMSFLTWSTDRWVAGGSTSDTSGEALAQASGFGPVWGRKHTRAHVCFRSPGLTADTWSNMPAAVTEYLGSTLHRARADLRSCTNARIVARVSVAGLSGSRLALQYSVDNGTTWHYMDGAVAGGSNSGTSTGCLLTTAGTIAGTWIALHANAQIESALLRLVGVGGDGVADPQIGNVHAEFR